MPFVPHDFYGPVYLDYGERVLTAEENRNYNGDGNGETNTLLRTLIGAVEDLTGRPIEVHTTLRTDDRVLAESVERGQADMGNRDMHPMAHAFGR
jgi:hypothetical protein